MKNVDKLHAVGRGGAGYGFTLAQTGDASLNQMITKLAKSDLERGRDLRRARRADRPAASSSARVVAAGMPLLLSIISIILALALTGLIGQVYPMNTFVLNILTMMGLAVGIDYTLFVISPLPRGARSRPRQDRRHRRHRRHRQPGHLLQRHDRRAGHARHGHRAARHHHQHGRSASCSSSSPRCSPPSSCCRPCSACSATASTPCACRSSGAWP